MVDFLKLCLRSSSIFLPFSSFMFLRFFFSFFYFEVVFHFFHSSFSTKQKKVVFHFHFCWGRLPFSFFFEVVFHSSIFFILVFQQQKKRLSSIFIFVEVVFHFHFFFEVVFHFFFRLSDNSMNNDKLSREALTVKNPLDPKADSNDAY
jgi:hypothetical protein